MNIGWIGTGIMGASMAHHIQNEGYALYVFNRTRNKAEVLLQNGACWCNSPAEVAARADVVFTIVGFPADVEEIYLGEKGLLREENPACRTVVDMTTSQPALARTIAAEAQKKQISAIDAPVSGGDVGARNGTLAIMCGGERTAFDAVFPLFQLMGENISYMGPAGCGQNTKMSNQILIAGTMVGVCESLLYAARSGLDQQQVIDIIGKGAASSWLINNLGPKIAHQDYNPGFFVDHFIKDMGIALDEAAALSLSLPGLALVHQLYTAVQAHGHGRSGTQALMLALESLNHRRSR